MLEYVRQRDQILHLEQHLIRLLNFSLTSHGSQISARLLQEFSSVQVQLAITIFNRSW